MSERFMFDTVEEQKGATVITAIKIMLLLITNGIPACGETLLALRLVARLNDIISDKANLVEVMLNEDKFIQMANQELEFLMKDK